MHKLLYPKSPAVLLALGLLLWASAASAAVTARFDRTEVFDGDTVTLLIEADGVGGAAPDLSVLNKDFDVLGTSSGSRIQIVNGRQSATRSWQVTLAPKRLGVVVVPPIAVGSERTPALELSVAEQPETPSGGPGDELFLEVEVGMDGDTVLVQQQVPLAVRLYTTLPLRGGELSEPRPEGAVLERLGEDVRYETTRNGRRYQVIERRFSLSPEQSGELRIPPVTFTGERETSGGRPFADDRLAQLFRDPVFERFGHRLFERGEPVRARSRAVTLEVEPQPQGFGGPHWLPAQELAIDDSWERAPPALANGEPATRTLTITATGLAGSQIPEIDVAVPDGVKRYPGDVEAETRTDGKALFGVSRQRITLMPTRGGTLVFPEIRLRWWDVDAGEERVAVVPARRLEAAGPVDGPWQAGVPEQAAAGAAADAGAAVADEPVSRVTGPRRPLGWLVSMALAAGVVGLLWPWRFRLLALAQWLGALLQRGRERLAAVAARPTAATADAAAASRVGVPAAAAASYRAARSAGPEPLAAVRAACAADDPRAAAAALLALARRRWPGTAPASPGAVAVRLAAEGNAAAQQAAAEVRALEAALYGPEPGAWRGGALMEALSALLAADGRAPRPPGDVGDAPLAPLYPDRR
ncbi:BatD family protein [Thiohalocapsa sp. ML1]|uniref:BatD family protein n=1 Tax=Thiohalocapsa sp. ML1 TaxID=1431688 RepID=UPI0007321D5D|nr:BatD family protein [Thiohalocapsa sp. ML1]